MAVYFPRIAARAAALSVLGALSFAAAPEARADLKVVQVKTLTGLAEMDAYSVPRTVTYYWKGDKYREDAPGGNIYFLYDCARDRYYVVDRANRVYTIMTLDEALNKRRGLLAQFTVDGTASVGEGGSTKTMGGQKAKNYTLQMDVRLKLERTGQTVLGVKMEGEQWTTTGNTGLSAKCQKILRAAYARGIFRYNKLLEPLFAKLESVKGVPLSYDMILSLQVVSPTEGLTGGTIEAHSELKGVSTKTLPASLFAVPKGYRLVDNIETDDLG